MTPEIRHHFDNLYNTDAGVRYTSYRFLIEATAEPVNWAYEVWDELLALLPHKDNHLRTIAVQLLSGLAKSDPEERMIRDIERLMAVTRDKRFVTARHSLQCLWKAGVVNETMRDTVLDRLGKRYNECISEKNCTLIRYDIIEVFRKMYDAVPAEKIKTISLELIETEADPKYHKKYTGLWKDLV